MELIAKNANLKRDYDPEIEFHAEDWELPKSKISTCSKYSIEMAFYYDLCSTKVREIKKNLIDTEYEIDYKRCATLLAPIFFGVSFSAGVTSLVILDMESTASINVPSISSQKDIKEPPIEQKITTDTPNYN